MSAAVLWIRGALGKGTLFRYPPSWVPTQAPPVQLDFAGLCEAFAFANLCSSLEKFYCSDPSALSVLDPATGEFLEHRQLRCDPKFKTVWGESYANELCRLCQGIGTGRSPNTKRVDGTNTFFLIEYDDIPAHKRKEICHTLVVCEVRPEKDDPDRT